MSSELPPEALCRHLPVLHVDGAGIVVHAGAGLLRAGLDPQACIGRPLQDVLAGHAARPRLDVVHGTSGDSLVFLGAAPATSAPAEPPTARAASTNDDDHAARLAILGRLVSSVVHELGSPLTLIRGHAQLLLNQPLAPDARADLERILDEAVRAARIAQSFLDFARRKPFAIEAVRLADVVTAALELTGHELRQSRIVAHVSIGDSLPPVRGDRQRLLQVLVNLVTNAQHAIAASAAEGFIAFEAHSRGSQVDLVVRDSGPGIGAADRERVFEPFFTTKAGAGTGLGLSICRDLLARQSASIRLDPGRRGEGAAFRITFAAAEPASGTAGATRSAAANRRSPRAADTSGRGEERAAP